MTAASTRALPNPIRDVPDHEDVAEPGEGRTIGDDTQSQRLLPGDRHREGCCWRSIVRPFPGCAPLPSTRCRRATNAPERRRRGQGRQRSRSPHGVSKVSRDHHQASPPASPRLMASMTAGRLIEGYSVIAGGCSDPGRRGWRARLRRPGQAAIRAAEGVLVVRPEHRRDRRERLGADTDGDGSSSRSGVISPQHPRSPPAPRTRLRDVNATVGDELDGTTQRTLGSMRITSSAPSDLARSSARSRHLRRSPLRHRRSEPFARRIHRVLRFR